MTKAQFPFGVLPAMITPFKVDKSIDWDGVNQLTDWYIESGVAGLFAVGQSSEMFALSDSERLQLAEEVVKRTDGRVPVTASGTFVRSITEQAEFIKKLFDIGVQVVVVLASQMAESDEDDSVWQRNVEQLLELTGDIPLALYECPAPYHRLISPELVHWAANTGRFHLLKETSRSIEQVQAKIEAAEGTPLGIYNADATTLLPSLRSGARGYCGIAANYYPEAIARLCEVFETQEADNIQALINMADPTIHHKYPVAAKYYRKQAGFDMLTISRVTDVEINAYEGRVLDSIASQLNIN
jgi:4-hydroxy-tetrahydrodipicolinate synthase